MGIEWTGIEKYYLGTLGTQPKHIIFHDLVQKILYTQSQEKYRVICTICYFKDSIKFIVPSCL